MTAEKKYDAYLLGWTGDYDSAYNFIGSFFGTVKNNEFGTEAMPWGEQLAQDMRDADAIVDDQERATAFETINQQIMEEYLPGLPISHSPPALVVGGDVDGLIPSPLTAEEFDTVSVGGSDAAVEVEGGHPPGDPPRYCSSAAHGNAWRRRLHDPVHRPPADPDVRRAGGPVAAAVRLAALAARRHRLRNPRRAADPERRAALEAALGLDQPIYVQYLKFLERAVHGDFGASTKVLPGTDAFDVFLTRLPATIELSVFAILIAVSLGIPFGYVAARRRGSALDNGSVIFSLVGVAVPVFFLAFMLKYFFAVQWHLLPVSGRQDPALDATRVTGFFVLDGLLTREWDAAWDAFQHLILPADRACPRSRSR